MDERLRRLERLAAAGDPDAPARLKAARGRLHPQDPVVQSAIELLRSGADIRMDSVYVDPDTIAATWRLGPKIRVQLHTEGLYPPGRVGIHAEVRWRPPGHPPSSMAMITPDVYTEITREEAQSLFSTMGWNHPQIREMLYDLLTDVLPRWRSPDGEWLRPPAKENPDLSLRELHRQLLLHPTERQRWLDLIHAANRTGLGLRSVGGKYFITGVSPSGVLEFNGKEAGGLRLFRAMFNISSPALAKGLELVPLPAQQNPRNVPRGSSWTSGACGTFAAELHAQTGLPIYATIHEIPGEPTGSGRSYFENAEGAAEIVHAFVLTPAGTGLDATGEFPLPDPGPTMRWESSIGSDRHPTTGEQGQWWVETTRPLTLDELAAARGWGSEDVFDPKIRRLAAKWIARHPRLFSRWISREIKPNPDESMRDLERRAALGDADARARYEAMRLRSEERSPLSPAEIESAGRDLYFFQDPGNVIFIPEGWEIDNGEWMTDNPDSLVIYGYGATDLTPNSTEIATLWFSLDDLAELWPLTRKEAQAIHPALFEHLDQIGREAQPNPDERMRDLERRAAAGDQEALAQLRAAQARIGDPNARLVIALAKQGLHAEVLGDTAVVATGEPWVWIPWAEIVDYVPGAGAATAYYSLAVFHAEGLNAEGGEWTGEWLRRGPANNTHLRSFMRAGQQPWTENQLYASKRFPWRRTGTWLDTTHISPTSVPFSAVRFGEAEEVAHWIANNLIGVGGRHASAEQMKHMPRPL